MQRAESTVGLCGRVIVQRVSEVINVYLLGPLLDHHAATDASGPVVVMRLVGERG